jgi:hypothetical protein
MNLPSRTVQNIVHCTYRVWFTSIVAHELISPVGENHENASCGRHSCDGDRFPCSGATGAPARLSVGTKRLLPRLPSAGLVSRRQLLSRLPERGGGRMFAPSHLQAAARVADKSVPAAAMVSGRDVRTRRGGWETTAQRWNWRRRRDSNPRYGFRPYNGLANRRLQPLGHVSGDETSVSATSGTVKDRALQAPQPRPRAGRPW